MNRSSWSKLTVTGILLLSSASVFSQDRAQSTAVAPKRQSPKSVPADSNQTGNLDRSKTLAQEEIVQLVRELGDKDYAKRRDAHRRLWHAGSTVVAELRQAAVHKSPEIAQRAKDLLRKIAFGLTPDMDPVAAAVVRRYQEGIASTKSSIISAMIAEQRYGLLSRLIRSEADPNVRLVALRTITYATTKALGQGLDDEKAKGLSELLRVAARLDREAGPDSANGIKSYAMYLKFTGQLDQQIEVLKQRIAKYVPPEDDPLDELNQNKLDKQLKIAGLIDYTLEDAHSIDLRMLAYFLAINGKLAEAYEASIEADDRDLQAILAFRLRKWDAFADESLSPAGSIVEKKCFALCMAYKLKQHDRVAEITAELTTIAKDSEVDAWTVGEALMICSEYEKAHEIFKLHHPGQAFELMVFQGRLFEALEFAGLSDHKEVNLGDWFSDRIKGLNEGPELNKQFELGTFVARTFHQMGYASQVDPLLEKLYAVAKLDQRSGKKMAYLIAIELNIRRNDLAALHLAEVLTSGRGNLQPLSYLLGDSYSSHPQFWLTAIRSQWPKESVKNQVTQVLALVKPWEERPVVGEFSEVIRLAVEFAKKNSDRRKRVANLEIIAATCMLHEEYEEARKLYQFLSTSSDIGSYSAARERAKLKYYGLIGGTYLAEKKWKEAADSLTKANKSTTLLPQTIWELGYAKTQMGKKEEGKLLIDRATMMPLANLSTRHDLISAIDEHGFNDEATKQREISLTIPQHIWFGRGAWAYHFAAVKIGDANFKTNKSLAGDLWETYLIYFLGSNRFYRARSYASLSHKIHRVRAMGHFKAGDQNKFAELSWAAHEAKHADLEYVISVFKDVENAKDNEAAQRLFDAVFSYYEDLCEEFPESPNYRNSIAWMSVSCGQRLEEALEFSKRSVELDRENPAYLDTLAAIYFELGDIDKAIFYQEKALQQRPLHKYFHEQLAKFKAAKLAG